MSRIVIHNHMPVRDMLPPNSTGKTASEWATEMAELRINQPRPIHKLWNNPDLAPPDQVAKQKEHIKEWERLYRRASKMQKIALKEDNETFYRMRGR